MNGDHPNAVAGPSSLPIQPAQHQPPTAPSPTALAWTSNNPPLLFLPPPLPPPPKQHLASTQDLLARFRLLPAYDRYVRPSTLPGDDPAIPDATVDKGKGRADAVDAADGGADGGDAADGADADDDDAPGAKGEKKKKNSYRHLIKAVPGKHSLKKDDYLSTMMLVPPKQRTRIRHFDAKTQEDAFTVSLEGLKGWNVNTLFLESAQAREDRKKRKELKRLAKLGLQGGPTPQLHIPGAGTPSAQSTGTPQPSSAGGLGAAHDQSIHAPVPVVAPRKMSAASTPRTSSAAGAGVPTPGAGVGAVVPGPVNVVPAGTGTGVGSGGGSSGNGVPRSSVPRPGSTGPRPGSAVPRPGSAVSTKQQQQRTSTPARSGTPMDVDAGQRGQKRGREDGVGSGIGGEAGGGGPGANGAHQNPYTALSNAHSNAANGLAHGNGNGNTNGNGNGHGNPYANGTQPRAGVLNAKAGTGNIRPRPVKKQRMDVQGQARDVSQPVQQQPTPQGV